MKDTKILQNLNERLDTKIYFMGMALDNGDITASETEYEDMKIQRNRNNDLLETVCNDPEEIEGHLADIRAAIEDTEELLNS